MVVLVLQRAPRLLRKVAKMLARRMHLRGAAPQVHSAQLRTDGVPSSRVRFFCLPLLLQPLRLSRVQPTRRMPSLWNLPFIDRFYFTHTKETP